MSGPARRRLVVAVVAALVAGACATDRTPDSFRPAGPQGRDTRTLTIALLGMGGGVWLIVTVLIVYAALVRRRANPGGASDDRFITVGGVVLPFAVLVAAGVLTVHYARTIRPEDTPDGALVVQVTGHEWWWEIAYPAEGVRTANEIHVPAGRPVAIDLTSADVIHSFWVPQLGGKLDANPGIVNRLVVRADDPGDLWGQCAEFCGLQHANMALVVHVDTPEVFGAWVDAHAGRTPAADTPAAGSLEARGQAVFFSQPCAGCHRIAGTQAAGTIAPDLSDLATRSTIGAGVLPDDPASLARWIRDPSDPKPGAHMPGFALGDGDMDALVAYLRSLR